MKRLYRIPVNDKAYEGIADQIRITLEKVPGLPARAEVVTLSGGDDFPSSIDWGPLSKLAPMLRERYGLTGPRVANTLMKLRAPMDFVSEVSRAMET